MTQQKRHTLVLSTQDIQQIVLHYGADEVMDELIERISRSFQDFDAEKTQIPKRAGFNYQAPEMGLVEWMPIYQKGKEVVIKVVGYHPSNPEKFELPTIVSTISSYDTTSGHLNSLMDGVFLTALRTGAASAVASRWMAHPQSKSIGLIGCGAQSVAQLHAISRIFDLETVYYYDIDSASQQSFEQRCAAMNLNVNWKAVDMDTVVAQADILCTATSIDVGAGPLFKDLPTKDHLHVNAIGSDFPGKTELPLDLLQQSFVCPDFYDQAIIEGECQQLTANDIDINLIGLAQNLSQYTSIKTQRTVFDSTGLSLEDEVVMNLFTQYATELNLGQYIAIEYMQEDAKNPYHFLGAVEEPALQLEPLKLKNLETSFHQFPSNEGKTNNQKENNHLPNHKNQSNT